MNLEKLLIGKGIEIQYYQNQLFLTGFVIM